MSKPPSLSARLEAILFAQGGPVSAAKLAKILSVETKAVHSGLAALRDDLSGRGLAIIESHAGYELAVAPELQPLANELTTETTPQLSQSSLEVLAIITYDGPVDKAHIDNIRGVASDSSLRALMSRDLIQQLKASGESGPRYELTSLAWQHLGLRSRKELPPQPKVKPANAPQ